MADQQEDKKENSQEVEEQGVPEEETESTEGNEGEENAEIEEDKGDEENEEKVGEDEEEPESASLSAQGPHFDFVEKIFYVSISIISDILDGIWITRFFFAPATISWLYFKGVKGIGPNAIAQLVELIPIINWLPITTVAALLTIWSTNNPESFNKFFGIAGKVLTKKAKV